MTLSLQGRSFCHTMHRDGPFDAGLNTKYLNPHLWNSDAAEAAWRRDDFSGKCETRYHFSMRSALVKLLTIYSTEMLDQRNTRIVSFDVQRIASKRATPLFFYYTSTFLTVPTNKPQIFPDLLLSQLPPFPPKACCPYICSIDPKQ